MNAAPPQPLTPPMTETPPRLYLISPSTVDPAAFLPKLEAALAAGDVACVLLSQVEASHMAELVQTVQAQDVAVLVRDDVALAAACGADGVHLNTPADLGMALRKLKPTGIVGAGGFATRDDAMTAGETEVDYLMFGDEAAGGADVSFEDRLDMVSWWAEIFRVPCVAVAHHPDEVEPFASAGADFIALSDVIWLDANGPAAAVARAMGAMKAGYNTFLARQVENV